MAMDQQETFNWLVTEKTRLESELLKMRENRDMWANKAFDFAFYAAKNNPAVKAQIERERLAENPNPETLNFLLG